MTTMKKLRWAMDGGFWDLDVSTPTTLDGLARPVPGNPLPLGLSRGTRLSRPKQIDFMQLFMTAPFVPSFAGAPARGGSGLTLQRVLAIPFGENWFATLLGQFNLQKFVSTVKEKRLLQEQDSTWWRGIGRHLRDKSLYALNFCSEMMLTSEDTLLVSLEEYGDGRTPRRKAVFHHKFPHHNLLVEAFSPGLFVSKDGTYWDVPLSIALDLASIASDSGTSYHLSMHHNSGSLRQYEGSEIMPTHGVPATLLPGTALKGAFSFKKNIDLWRSKAPKLKLVQPYDVFLSNPHVSASGIVGAGVTASFGDNAIKSDVADVSQDDTGICFNAPVIKSALKGDAFAAVAFSAQHGNFQSLFLDLTRFHACLDFPSGSNFLSGAVHLAQDLLNSQRPKVETLQAICPNATLSLQQQIGGPFSVRVDSRVSVDLKDRDRPVHIDDSVFAVEYALQVLGSAKAVAWYAPKRQEFMVELRFFET
ncbi:hypothetical protein BT93_B1852 [Corymbia citriodora subsp. variegata]|nr:hypothetical protein BT93_B1852 [Corymbia citriodora subsp. variegata]